jgi:amino acid transporter
MLFSWFLFFWKHNTGFTTGIIVGIIVGILVLLAIIGVAFWYFTQQRAKSSYSEQVDDPAVNINEQGSVEMVYICILFSLTSS